MIGIGKGAVGNVKSSLKRIEKKRIGGKRIAKEGKIPILLASQAIKRENVKMRIVIAIWIKTEINIFFGIDDNVVEIKQIWTTNVFVYHCSFPF